MPALLLKLLGPVWSLLSLTIPLPVALIVATFAWAHFDKSSAVRKAVDGAIEELVVGAEVEALRAQLTFERGMRQAAELALAGFSRALAEAERREAAQNELREQEIADYEDKLTEAGRSCLLDDADLEWLRR